MTIIKVYIIFNYICSVLVKKLTLIVSRLPSNSYVNFEDICS